MQTKKRGGENKQKKQKESTEGKGVDFFLYVISFIPTNF